MNFKVLFPTILTASTLVTHVSADIKAYHGAVCTLAEPVLAQLEHNELGVANVDGFAFFTTLVTCPLIRDRINSSANLSRVVIEAFNSADELSCTLFSQREDTSGAVLDFHTQTLSTTGNVQFPSFTVTTTSGNEGSYAVTCDLGALDRVSHIFVEELNGSD
jgi:hypothetical protein